jgi:very-short-patch-repair endonuclease
MADHERLRELAARQHGIVTRAQLTDAGFSAGLVAHHLRAGRLERLSRRVLRLTGTPDTPDQRAMAAALDVAGGAVALFSAAARWELAGFTLEPVHVMSTRRPHRGGSHLGRMHSSVRFDECDVVAVRGVPTTSPLRTLCDLAGRIHIERLDLACERMLARRILRLDDLRALSSTLPSHSRSTRAKALRLLCERRPGDHRPAESGLERRFEQILRDAGDAPFERQVDLGDADGWIGRVDFVDRSCKVVVEVQSDLFHTGGVDQRRDAERVARLRRAGWTVLEVTEFEIWHRPSLVVHQVRQARAGAARHRGSTDEA